jgi:hypothetical protein
MHRRVRRIASGANAFKSDAPIEDRDSWIEIAKHVLCLSEPC